MSAAGPPEPTVLFWDIETDSTFSALPGATHEQKCDLMQPTVVCALECPAELCARAASSGAEPALRAGRRVHYWRDGEVAEGARTPFDDLLARMDRASVIVAYNGLGFDHHVMRKFYGRSKDAAKRWISHRAKTLDLFARIREATGCWPKLDALLAENGLSTKTADGLEAIRMWEQGRREELLHYCEVDVEQMARLSLLPSVRIPQWGLELPDGLFSLAAALAPVCAARGDGDGDGWENVPQPADSRVLVLA